jgi:hypothetical protein
LTAIGSFALSIYKKFDIKIVAKYTLPAVAATIILDCIISKIASRNKLKQLPLPESQPTPEQEPALPSIDPILGSQQQETQSESDSDSDLPLSTSDTELTSLNTSDQPSDSIPIPSESILLPSSPQQEPQPESDADTDSDHELHLDQVPDSDLPLAMSEPELSLPDLLLPLLNTSAQSPDSDLSSTDSDSVLSGTESASPNLPAQLMEPCSSHEQPEQQETPRKSGIHTLLFDTPTNLKQWKLDIKKLNTEEIKSYVEQKHGNWFGIPEKIRFYLIWNPVSISLITEFLNHIKDDSAKILDFYFDLLSKGGPQLRQIIPALENSHPLERNNASNLIAKILECKNKAACKAACTVLFSLKDRNGILPFQNHATQPTELTIQSYEKTTSKKWVQFVLKLRRTSLAELSRMSPRTPEAHPAFDRTSSSNVSRPLKFGTPNPSIPSSSMNGISD